MYVKWILAYSPRQDAKMKKEIRISVYVVHFTSDEQCRHKHADHRESNRKFYDNGHD